MTLTFCVCYYYAHAKNNFKMILGCDLGENSFKKHVV